MRKTFQKAILITIVLVFSFLLPALPAGRFNFYLNSVYAFQQSSTNYQLEGDFNIFSGSKSSSNYSLTDTGGGLGPGAGTSENYGIGAGFQYVLAKSPNIAFTISKNLIDLNVLSEASISKDTLDLLVTTSLSRGYKVYISEDHDLQSGSNTIVVSDGTINAGEQEYGVATDKTLQDVANSDCTENDSISAITTSNQSVASATTDVTGDPTQLCFAASKTGSTPAGSYSHTVTFIIVGNF
ncbi:MAG: hypothetical protein A2172_01705 [Candidatus Woykebacteria bacterium RBG_13_40_15]|uniref:Uncharacterized protein n=1 Tax=Candidatus Woykebacteria bacterium RBG_13_40_15 TaxID=1802593 RepID=A0A1G1W9N7_9BACT|nr:MAG: hypothetical protein A2172_01705 [Candidatus Woykebacteria bacterium RBG_13_40_15]